MKHAEHIFQQYIVTFGLIQTRRLLIQELAMSQTQLAVLEQQLQQQRLRYAMQDSSEGVALLERERIKRQVRSFM